MAKELQEGQLIACKWREWIPLEDHKAPLVMSDLSLLTGVYADVEAYGVLFLH